MLEPSELTLVVVWLLVPSWFVVWDCCVLEPSVFTTVVDSVWLTNPSSLTVVDLLDVVVVPSWLCVTVCVSVVTEPSSPTVVVELVLV